VTDHGIWSVPSAPNPSVAKLKTMPWWYPLRGDVRLDKIVSSLALK
jgi:hypothetical protein